MNVEIRSKLYTDNARITPDGACCINFYNQGDDTAYLFGDTMVPPGSVHEFNFDPTDEITSEFDLRFDFKNENRQVVVTKIIKQQKQ